MTMFIARMSLILAAFGLAATGAFGQEAAPSADSSPAPPSKLETLAETCSAHKFETIVKNVTADGRTRGSRVKICGEPGQTDADWLITLKDSMAKTESNQELTPAVRTQIIVALKAEIGRLEEAALAAATVAPLATIAVSHAPVSVPEAPPEYASVPQLPAPLPRVGTARASAASPPLVRPRLSLRCALPHESFAECRRLERETQLSIRADEDLADGISLRFLRGGDTRADLDLGALKAGAALRERLPSRVCAGVLRGKVQVQVLSKGRVADTLGPFALYCGS
jgi:hypothetical protein